MPKQKKVTVKRGRDLSDAVVCPARLVEGQLLVVWVPGEEPPECRVIMSNQSDLCDGGELKLPFDVILPPRRMPSTKSRSGIPVTAD